MRFLDFCLQKIIGAEFAFGESVGMRARDAAANLPDNAPNHFCYSDEPVTFARPLALSLKRHKISLCSTWIATTLAMHF